MPRVLRTLGVVLALMLGGGLWSQALQPLALSFNLTPYFGTPFDQVSSSSPKPLYLSTMGTRGSVDDVFPRLPFLSVGMLGDFQYLQTQDPYQGLGTLGVGAQSAMARLQTLDKKLADRYSYLNAAGTSTTGARASEAGQLESLLVWKA